MGYSDTVKLADKLMIKARMSSGDSDRRVIQIFYKCIYISDRYKIVIC